MTKISRRIFLFGGAASLLSGPAVFSSGVSGYLRSVLADHFGDHILQIDGIDEFISAYATQAGSDNWTKKIMAELYFRYGGPHFIPTAGVAKLRETFLQTVLTRSNIIAIAQGRVQEFDYSEVNPYQATCGLYLSAYAED